MARPSPTLTFPLSASDLAKWSRFATNKGGIGRAVALVDRFAQDEVDLMFFGGDEITVLYALEDGEHLLGYCEGVCGRIRREDVQIVGRLKVRSERPSGLTSQRPVFTKRARSHGDHSPPVGVETPPDSPLDPPNAMRRSATQPTSTRSSSVSSLASMARVRSASGDTTGTSAHTHALAEVASSYRFGSSGHIAAGEDVERIGPDEDVDNLADYYRYSRHDEEPASLLSPPA